MIMLAVLAVILASVPLTGARFAPLAGLPLKWLPLAFSGLGIQIVIIQIVHGIAPPDVLAVVHVGSYAILGVFLAVNLHVPGLWLLGLGGMMNGVAIAANDGVMPATPEAAARAGIEQTGEFVNSAATADANLWFLGDIFWIPEGWPLANVFSVGDVLILVGAAWMLHVVGRWSTPATDGAAADVGDEAGAGAVDAVAAVPAVLTFAGPPPFPVPPVTAPVVAASSALSITDAAPAPPVPRVVVGPSGLPVAVAARLGEGVVPVPTVERATAVR